ncbi:GNAT family N-acetyltransferase [Streptantibioticus ferralitis]|uniref:GNAT family N-acetyltransferase n=1 Tax=Streptantibioticus ferralitis TaxID=236510 RepID=A0ABT5Z5I1_9ACTN|nr:GNAT family N-acetyltransferase [Streptantibioticus ferralitis]MDF2259092.1 GNAT family N-acetyltransferase [Streptantibioticus ferralitis]
MELIIRPFRPADAEAAAGVRDVVAPYLVTTPQVMAWRAAEAPAAQRYRMFVAEIAERRTAGSFGPVGDAGRSSHRIVGVAATGLIYESSAPGQAFANLQVLPDVRGQGVGTALLTAAEEYLAGLGAVTVFAWVVAEESSLDFARRRGYRPGRSASFQRLDLAGGALPAVPEVPFGYALRTGADFAADPRPLYQADAEAAADEPGDASADAMGYDDWLAQYWAAPDLDRELTTAVVADGTVVAFSLAHTDGRSRYASGMTGTRRRWRGRGLAKLAKASSLHRARAAGYTEAFTANDTGNGPMLAVNAWFGYRQCATETRYALSLTGE